MSRHDDPSGPSNKPGPRRSDIVEKKWLENPHHVRQFFDAIAAACERKEREDAERQQRRG